MTDAAGDGPSGELRRPRRPGELPGPGTLFVDWLRKYPLAPRYARRHRMRLTTADGVRLAAAHLPGPPDAPLTVVLAHGFLNSSRSPTIHRFAHLLAERTSVIVPDLRGHGGSGGVCTLGRLESLDVAAAVAAAVADRPVVTVGISLGGVAVLRHAGSHGGVAGVVSVSAPAWWGDRTRPAADRLGRLVASGAARGMTALLLRTRVARHAPPLAEPVELMARIAPAFTIVVHDPDDHVFVPQHAEALYTWARDPKDLWWVPGAGHGIDVLTPAFAERLLDELTRRVRDPWRSGTPGPARPSGTG